MMIDSKIYNPASQPKEWLIEHFVVRTKIFEKLFKDIKNGKMKYPEQNYLIQGQRGMGKTTLLLRLKYEIENDAELNSWLVPVFFNEESYDLTTLSNLWEKLLKYLDNLWNTNGTYYSKTDEFVGKPDYEKKCFDLLIGILKEHKKKLIIFFDNFGQLFLDNLADKEQHRLREILMNNADIRIIGASHVVMDDLYDYSKPFFEFFKIINLQGLTKEETVELIVKLNDKSEGKIDIERNKAKIETLAILTGGVIRTIMLIYEAILSDQDGTALRDLEMILDRITPLYKHRIEDLPVQQRKIVDVIAKKWDAVSAKEIAGAIRENGQTLSTKLISAQLQQLERNNIIEKKATDTKNNLYQLQERFFNIWYLMRSGDRYDKCRVKWLTKFLELFYDDSFDNFLKQHIKHLRSGNYHPGSALMISEALANSDKLDVVSKNILLRETSSLLSPEQKRQLPDLTNQIIEKSRQLVDEERYDESIQMLNSIDTKSNQVKLFLGANYILKGDTDSIREVIKSINPNNNSEKYGLGILHFEINDFQKSLQLIQEYDGHNIAEANYFIGCCLVGLDRIKEGIEYLEKSVAEGFLKSYVPLVKLLVKIQKNDLPERYCIEAIERGVSSMKVTLLELYLFPPKLDVNGEKSIMFLNEELKKTPHDPVFNYFIGLTHYFNANFDRAREFFLKAYEIFQQDKFAYFPYNHMNFLLLLNVSVEYKKDKKFARNILADFNGNKFGFILLYSAIVKVWDDKFSEALDILSDYLMENQDSTLEMETMPLQEIFLLFMSKRQYHSVLKLFNDKKYNLKDKFKPIYYTLMHYMKDEFPNEHLRMGEELKQPVADLMKRVEEMAIEYA